MKVICEHIKQEYPQKEVFYFNPPGDGDCFFHALGYAQSMSQKVPWDEDLKYKLRAETVK